MRRHFLFETVACGPKELAEQERLPTEPSGVEHRRSFRFHVDLSELDLRFRCGNSVWHHSLEQLRLGLASYFDNLLFVVPGLMDLLPNRIDDAADIAQFSLKH